MLKDKRNRYSRQKLRQQAMEILKKHSEPSPENTKTYPAQAMKKLHEWKHNKKSTEGQEKLLKAHHGAPVPLKDPDWSMSEEARLKDLLTADMHAKDAALGVQLKQTAKAIANNVDDLDEESKAELLRVLQDKQGGESAGDNQRFPM